MSESPHDEVLDGLPVLPGEPFDLGIDISARVEPMPISRALSAPLAAPIQTAAAAAGGFVAGAALLGLVRRRHDRRAALVSTRATRRLPRPGRRTKSVGKIAEVVATRSFLVDVHMLGIPGRDR